MSIDRIIYYSALAIAFGGGLVRIKYLDKSSKIIIILLALTLITEFVSYIADRLFGNNFPVFHVFTVLELILFSFYFIQLNQLLRQNFFIILPFLWVFIAGLNIYFFEPLLTLNTNMLIIEGFSISVMAIYSLYRIMMDNKITVPYQNIHFWILALMLILWCSTYFFWSFYKILAETQWPYWNIIHQFHWLINVIVYLGISLVYIFIPKKEKS